MSSTMRTLQRIVPSYDSPRGRAVDRGKVAEAAQETAEAGVPHAAQAAQAAEGRMEVRKGGAVFGTARVRTRQAAWQRLFGRHVVA